MSTGAMSGGISRSFYLCARVKWGTVLLLGDPHPCLRLILWLKHGIHSEGFFTAGCVVEFGMLVCMIKYLDGAMDMGVTL